jgi:hypothetical protein
MSMNSGLLNLTVMKLCTLDTYGGKLLSKAAIDAQFDVVSKKTVFKDRLKF